MAELIPSPGRGRCLAADRYCEDACIELVRMDQKFRFVVKNSEDPGSLWDLNLQGLQVEAEDGSVIAQHVVQEAVHKFLQQTKVLDYVPELAVEEAPVCSAGMQWAYAAPHRCKLCRTRDPSIRWGDCERLRFCPLIAEPYTERERYIEYFCDVNALAYMGRLLCRDSRSSRACILEWFATYEDPESAFREQWDGLSRGVAPSSLRVELYYRLVPRGQRYEERNGVPWELLLLHRQPFCAIPLRQRLAGDPYLPRCEEPFFTRRNLAGTHFLKDVLEFFDRERVVGKKRTNIPMLSFFLRYQNPILAFEQGWRLGDDKSREKVLLHLKKSGLWTGDVSEPTYPGFDVFLAYDALMQGRPHVPGEFPLYDPCMCASPGTVSVGSLCPRDLYAAVIEDDVEHEHEEEEGA